MKRGGFPRAPRVFAGAYLVYRNYFSLLCFSFYSRKAAPTRTNQPPVFRPAILHKAVVVVWWHGHCAFPLHLHPEGNTALVHAFFLLIFLNGLLLGC